MKKLMIFCFALLAIGHYACNSAVESDSTENQEVGDDENSKVRGAEFEMVNVEKFDDFIVSMEGIDTMDAIVTGKVESVCKKKGCWMNVVSENGNDKMFVQFYDYGFFMPLDITGKTVTMKGTAFKSVTPVDELKHYAEDEGKSKEEIDAITEPKAELKFLATGVVIGD